MADLTRQERQARSRAATKCWCGNEAKLGTQTCGRHTPDEELEADIQSCDPLLAINWVLDHYDGMEATTFLRAWREGDFHEWPEYLAWVEAQHG